MTSRIALRWLSLCLTASLPVAVGSCGFQPIYMPTASGKPGVAQRELAAVFVPVIAERPGQLLRQALQKRFGDDSGAAAAYDLRVSFSVSGEGIAIQQDTIATRVRLVGTANWTLISREPGQGPLASGSARAFDAINIFDEQYFAADLETEAVQGRIAENIAQQITLQLAAWFRKQAPQTADRSG
jgi:LPS-assembly lipoprotein